MKKRYFKKLFYNVYKIYTDKVCEIFKNVGINININESALEADFAGDQWFESFFDISLLAACGKNMQFPCIPTSKVLQQK